MDRQCVKCLHHKPITDFSAHKSSADGLRTACKSCSNAATRSWRVGKTERIKKTEQAWRLANPERTEYLNRRGNLTVEQYDDMLLSQNYQCALCLTDKPGGRGRFHVDHDHACCPGTANSCGKCVRGLLCHRCNVMIAHAQDSVERLADAIVYLLDWENSNMSNTDNPKMVTIVVEGVPHEWPKNEDISHAQVVTLEVPDYPQHTEITYAVTYRNGHREKPEGILAQGASVKVKEGMIFSVSEMTT